MNWEIRQLGPREFTLDGPFRLRTTVPTRQDAERLLHLFEVVGVK